MGLDAIPAFLHYTAIFMLFGFLVTEVMAFRMSFDEKMIRLLGRIDRALIPLVAVITARGPGR